MFAANLLTKYTLAPIWIRIFSFFSFYWILLYFHYFNFDSLAECMPTFDSKEVENRVFKNCRTISNISSWQSIDDKLFQIAAYSKIQEECSAYLQSNHRANDSGTQARKEFGAEIYGKIMTYIQNSKELKQQHQDLFNRNFILEQQVKELEATLTSSSKTIESLQFRGHSAIQQTILDYLPEQSENENLKIKVSTLESELKISQDSLAVSKTIQSNLERQVSEQASLIERLSIERKVAPGTHDLDMIRQKLSADIRKLKISQKQL